MQLDESRDRVKVVYFGIQGAGDSSIDTIVAIDNALKVYVEKGITGQQINRKTSKQKSQPKKLMFMVQAILLLLFFKQLQEVTC